MYSEHPSLKTPGDSEIVWRYFDFASFLSMVSSNTLYFCRCDHFADKWDASYSLAPFLRSLTLLSDQDRVIAARHLLSQQEYMRESTFANCWHKNRDESAAMWEIYTARRSGIAVQSTIRRLKDAFRKCVRNVWISEVIYGDFDQPDLIDGTNALPPLFVKRKEYSFEQEVRVLIWSLPPTPSLSSECDPEISENDIGVAYPIDVGTLIESVVVSPSLGSHVVTSVQALLTTLGLSSAAVRHSKLASMPMRASDFDAHEPRLFDLSIKAEARVIKMLLEACNEYHLRNYNDASMRSVDALNAVSLAATRAGYLPPE